MTGQIKVSVRLPMHERIFQSLEQRTDFSLYSSLLDALNAGDATWLQEFTTGFGVAVQTYMMRYGLMRRLLAKSVCNQGQMPRIPIRNRASRIATTLTKPWAFDVQSPAGPAHSWVVPQETHFIDRHSFKYTGSVNVIHQEFTSAIRRLMSQGEQKTMFDMVRYLATPHRVSRFDAMTFDSIVRHMQHVKGTKPCYAVLGSQAWLELKTYLPPSELCLASVDPMHVAERGGVAILSEGEYPWLDFGKASLTVGADEFFLFTEPFNVGAYTDRDRLGVIPILGDVAMHSAVTTTTISIALTNELGIERGEII